MPHATIDAPEKLPLYIQQEMVPFPYMVFPVYVNDRDLQTFTEADQYDKLVAVVLRRPTGPTADRPGEVSEIGTLCRVNQIKKVGDGKFKVTLEGLTRLRILETELAATVIMARCEVLSEFVEKNMVSDALVQSLRTNRETEFGRAWQYRSRRRSRGSRRSSSRRRSGATGASGPWAG